LRSGAIISRGTIDGGALIALAALAWTPCPAPQSPLPVASTTPATSSFAPSGIAEDPEPATDGVLTSPDQAQAAEPARSAPSANDPSAPEVRHPVPARPRSAHAAAPPERAPPA